MAIDFVQLAGDSATIVLAILAVWKNIANRLKKLDSRIERLEDMLFQALLQRLQEYTKSAPPSRT